MNRCEDITFILYFKELIYCFKPKIISFGTTIKTEN